MHSNQITNNMHLRSGFSCKPCSSRCIPERVARFVKHHLHGGPPESIDAEALQREVEELRQKNKELQEQVSQLQTAVCHVITISHSRKTQVYPMQAYLVPRSLPSILLLVVWKSLGTRLILFTLASFPGARKRIRLCSHIGLVSRLCLAVYHLPCKKLGRGLERDCDLCTW